MKVNASVYQMIQKSQTWYRRFDDKLRTALVISSGRHRNNGSFLAQLIPIVFCGANADSEQESGGIEHTRKEGDLQPCALPQILREKGAQPHFTRQQHLQTHLSTKHGYDK